MVSFLIRFKGKWENKKAFLMITDLCQSTMTLHITYMVRFNFYRSLSWGKLILLILQGRKLILKESKSFTQYNKASKWLHWACSLRTEPEKRDNA